MKLWTVWLLAAATLLFAAAGVSAQSVDTESTEDTEDTESTETAPLTDLALSDVQVCDPRAGIGVLFLYDTSASLRRTDPQAKRRDGGLAALDDLLRLSAEYSQTPISVAVDGFADDYQSGMWVRLQPDTDEAPTGLSDRIRAVGARNDGQRTDYRAALQGGAATLRDLPAERCARVIWFTDGSHDTEGTSEFTDIESAEIDAMCADGGETELLNRLGAHVTAVQLSAGASDGTAESLLRLFGEGDSSCAHPLNGEIVDAPSVTALTDILRSNTENSGWEAIEDPPETLPCIQERTEECEFSFAVGSEASFDVYIDLSAATNGRYPTLTILNPAGETSDVLTFNREPTVDPATGLLTWAPTQTWRQIRGHIAAEQIEERTGEWGWEGEWRILASGENAGVMHVTPPRVARGAAPTLTVASDRNGDRIGGTVTGVDGSEAAIRVTLADDDTVTLLDDDVSVTTDGTWATDGLHSCVTGALLESGRPVVDGVPVRVKLVLSFDWGDSTLVWEPPWAQQIVMVIPATTDGSDGRFCRSLNDSTQIACAWTFRLADSDEKFSVLIERIGAVSSGTVEAALITPSGERQIVDVTTDDGQMPVELNRETDSGVVYVHRAVQTETASYALWAGDWQIEFAGTYDMVGEMPTPELQVHHSPSLTARFDPDAGALRGVVSRPGGQIGDPPQGAVRLRLELPGSGFHGKLIGPEEGYELTGGRWVAERIVDAVMEISGVRAVLRETGGSLEIRAVYQGSTVWGTGDKQTTVRWEAPHVYAVASLSIPSSFGWGVEFVHPWVQTVNETGDTSMSGDGFRVAVSVRPGLEAGRIVVDDATLRDSKGGTHSLEAAGWSCEVSKGDGSLSSLFECPPLILTYPDSAAAGNGRIDISFVSSLNDEVELVNDATERDLAEQASHLYRPVLQPIQVSVIVPSKGSALLPVLVVVFVVAAVGVSVWLLWRRKRSMP